MSNPLWCVVARNRLTGEREVISKPMPKDAALLVKLDYTNVKGSNKPYSHAKVALYNPQLELF